MVLAMWFEKLHSHFGHWNAAISAILDFHVPLCCFPSSHTHLLFLGSIGHVVRKMFEEFQDGGHLGNCNNFSSNLNLHVTQMLPIKFSLNQIYGW